MNYQRLTPRLILGLAAPHTWPPASILPVLFAAALCLGETGAISPLLFFALLAISILMQSAVNTLNDYFDFIKGTDDLSNSPDSYDAVLVYHNLNPRQVMLLGLAFLALAALLGLYVVWQSGWIPLLLGCLGGLTVLLYSAGKKPISYTPFGEFFSGLMMGGLLPLAVYCALSGQLAWRVLYQSLPLILGIGLIMMTNNTSDIERDRASGRATWPARLGRTRARLAYRLILTLWLLLLLVIMLQYFPGGLFVLPLGLLYGLKALLRLFRADFTPENREQSMLAIFRANLAVNGSYLVAVLVAFLRV